MKTNKHFQTSVTLDDRQYDVEFDVTNIDVANDGIGSYEFWGQKGYDRGMDYVEEFTIENLKAFEIIASEDDSDDTLKAVADPTVLERIQQTLYDNDDVQLELGEYLIESKQQEPDYPDPNDER